MIKVDQFLVSFDVLYITGEIIHFCEPMLVAYRTEELGPYLRIPNEELNPDHLHMRSIRGTVDNIFLCKSQIKIIDIIRTEYGYQL